MKALAIVVLSVWTGLAGALTARAQSVKTIYSFNNTSGANPYASLTLGLDGNFYGATYSGGSNNYGTLFQVTTNGALNTLVYFNSTNGANPYAGLTLGPDGNWYGTTVFGGNLNLNGGLGDGTVFRMTTNGALTTLVQFNGTNGAQPSSALTLGPDGNFYGTTYSGGISNNGTVFQVTTDGTLATLVNFNYPKGPFPSAGLTLGPDGNFYGTTYHGGSGKYGTVFQMTTNGTLTTLVNFKGTNGADPTAALTLGPDGNFYGTTPDGGSTPSGTVFMVTTNDTFTTLVNFYFSSTSGAYPYAGLTLGPDGNFYGTTTAGGGPYGIVFKLSTNGTLTTLAGFNNTTGSYCYDALTLGPDGNFYGTAYQGGIANLGTIFQLELPPEFITAPTNQTAVIGGNVTFNSHVFGTGPFAYQWLSNGIPIDGATNATLSFNQALANQAGSYQLVASNAFGSVTSQPVSLNVLVQPNIYAISNNGADNLTLSLASYPNSTNRLWSTTNLALPFAQWQVIATNVTDGNGLSQSLDTNTAGMPQKFYRLSCP